MADKNRGRSVDGDDRSDDVDDVDDELVEVDDDDEADDLADDAEGDVDDDAEPARPRKKKVPASAGAVARSKSKDTGKRSGGILGFGRLSRFIREIVAELQKVIWPTRKELLTYTSVVVVFVAVMMTFVALLDLGFVRVMFLVFGRNPGATTP